MTKLITPQRLDERLIASGIHLDLTPALKAVIREKVGKLLRHEPRMVRVRLDLEHDQTKGAGEQFVAKGRIEIGGPDLLAQAATADAYRSVDEVVAKLDRALRKRAADRKGKRNHPRPPEIGEIPKTT